MRTASAVLAIVFLCGERDPGGDPARKTAVEAEIARFQGTWQLLSAEKEGKKSPEETVKQITVTIKGNTHTVRFGDQVVAHNVSFEVDPSKNPKWTTDTITEGPDKGKQILGIYKLEGDTLTSCVAPLGKDRPTEFSAKPGSNYTLRTFKRATKGEPDKPETKSTKD